MARTGIGLALVVLTLAFSLPHLGRIDFSLLSSSLQDFVDVKTYEWFIGDCRTAEQVQVNDSSTTSHLSEVHIVYAADERRFPALLRSMISLSHHLAAEADYVIHIIVPELDLEQASRVADCFKLEMDSSTNGRAPVVKLHVLRPTNLNLTSFKPVWQDVWPEGGENLIPLSFVEVYLPEYLQGIPRVIWLSVDTLVKCDVGQLYRTPMQHAVAASLDMEWVTWKSEYEKDLEETDDLLFNNVPNWQARTLNSGVLVIDLARWQADGLTRKLENLVNRVKGIKTVQLAFNLEFQDRFDVLDWRWNVMGLMMVPPRRCIDESRILHFAGPLKPGATTGPERIRIFHDGLVAPFRPVQECNYAPTPMLDSDFDFPMQ